MARPTGEGDSKLHKSLNQGVRAVGPSGPFRSQSPLDGRRRLSGCSRPSPPQIGRFIDALHADGHGDGPG